MRTLFERSVLAGIGVLSLTHEKAQKIIDELIRSGEVQKDEAREWVDCLIHHGEEEHLG
jgi:polyhydroxyalkanoate synthesis regulator phasin